MPGIGEEGDEASAEAERARTSDRIVDSNARKKLVVAGPGTGKTHNFKRVLEKAGGGQALTFIRALAADLEKDLGDFAHVNTFHGYCKHVAHSLGGVGGLTAEFQYFPALSKLIVEDLAIVGYPGVEAEDFERRMGALDEDELVRRVLKIGNYYDTVGHTDVVYRVLGHLKDHPTDVPQHEVLVVDEYQDFNRMETSLIDVLGDVSPVLIAGDDDQALYGFKGASADFIRDLATADGVERFDLPYCSRCTEVIVEAVNQIAYEAQQRGKLADRVDREYLCYLPDKQGDSDDNPTLIHAACSVHNKKCPYPSRYVAEQIAAIPPTHVEASRSGGYPTALVIGPSHHVKPIFEYLDARFNDVKLLVSSRLEVSRLDGYRYLAEDDSSRLGWRILMHVDNPDGWQEMVARALTDDSELAQGVASDYREPHLDAASLVSRLLGGDGLSSEEAARLEAAVGKSIEAISVELGIVEADEEEEPDSAEPSIICTSLVGAKGLSAEHVFVAGFNNGDFPSDPADVTDTEVCELIVALSRTRKSCHLISCSMWAGPPPSEPSVFLSWLDDVAFERRKINKSYFES